MCLGRKVKPIEWEYGEKIALLFGSNYPHTDYELNGCINDLIRMRNLLEPLGFQIREFRNEDVTIKRFEEEILYAFNNAKRGDVIYIHFSGHGTQVRDRDGDEVDGYDEALYFTNGAYIDDRFGALLSMAPEGVDVIIGLDCCFSGTATRGPDRRARFKPPRKFHKIRQVRVKRILSDMTGRVVFSGCSEDETSADAYINDMWCGAFTFYFANSYEISLTYQKWFEKLRLYLPNKNFSQKPTLEGDETLFNKVTFTNTI